MPCSTQHPKENWGSPEYWGRGMSRRDAIKHQEGYPSSNGNCSKILHQVSEGGQGCISPEKCCCLKATQQRVDLATQGCVLAYIQRETQPFWGEQPPTDADSFRAKFHTSIPKHG